MERLRQDLSTHHFICVIQHSIQHIMKLGIFLKISHLRLVDTVDANLHIQKANGIYVCTCVYTYLYLNSYYQPLLLLAWVISGWHTYQWTCSQSHVSFYFLSFFNHMCIHCLGHFSLLPPTSSLIEIVTQGFVNMWLLASCVNKKQKCINKGEPGTNLLRLLDRTKLSGKFLSSLKSTN
jgi:hypothetical protein